MLRLLKRLGASCWGDHEWMYRTGERGLWLECRQCGRQSAGLELPPAHYRRTQEAVAAKHRLAPAGRSPEPEPAGQRFGRRLTALPAASPAAPLSEAERRWLQTWRALTPDERIVAEQVVARIVARADAERVPHAS